MPLIQCLNSLALESCHCLPKSLAESHQRLSTAGIAMMGRLQALPMHLAQHLHAKHAIVPLPCCQQFAVLKSNLLVV